MDIYIYTNDREEIIKFPVIPNEITISSPQKNETFETINMGELKIIGLKGLKTFSLNSFFPSKDYPFLKDRTYKGFEYVDIIEQWREKDYFTEYPLKFPLRITIIGDNMDISMPIAIDTFEYGIKDASNDVWYTLGISEYKFAMGEDVQRRGSSNYAQTH